MNQDETEALARRLHKSLDDMLILFVGGARLKYGEYITLDQALDALAESARELNVPLTATIAEVIRAKQGYVWESEQS